MCLHFRQKICCGTVYVGPCGAVLVDVRLMKSTCPKRTPCAPLSPPSTASSSSKSKAFSDNSSDSGYDESSNHSLPQPISNN